MFSAHFRVVSRPCLAIRYSGMLSTSQPTIGHLACSQARDHVALERSPSLHLLVSFLTYFDGLVTGKLMMPSLDLHAAYAKHVLSRHVLSKYNKRHGFEDNTELPTRTIDFPLGSHIPRSHITDKSAHIGMVGCGVTGLSLDVDTLAAIRSLSYDRATKVVINFSHPWWTSLVTKGGVSGQTFRSTASCNHQGMTDLTRIMLPSCRTRGRKMLPAWPD